MTKFRFHNKTKKGAAALIIAAIIATALLFTGCPNNAGGGGSGGATVNITVKGDTNINLPAEAVAVRAGAKWAEAKSTVQGKVSPKPNFLVDSWHLGDGPGAPEIQDTDAFSTDTTIFVASRADLPGISSIQGHGPQVKIKFELTDSNAGFIRGPNPISVDKGTPWNPLLKDYATAALKVNYGFKCKGWKMNGNLKKSIKVQTLNPLKL